MHLHQLHHKQQLHRHRTNKEAKKFSENLLSTCSFLLPQTMNESTLENSTKTKEVMQQQQHSLPQPLPPSSTPLSMSLSTQASCWQQPPTQPLAVILNESQEVVDESSSSNKMLFKSDSSSAPYSPFSSSSKNCVGLPVASARCGLPEKSESSCVAAKRMRRSVVQNGEDYNSNDYSYITSHCRHHSINDNHDNVDSGIVVKNENNACSSPNIRKNIRENLKGNMDRGKIHPGGNSISGNESSTTSSHDSSSFPFTTKTESAQSNIITSAISNFQVFLPLKVLLAKTAATTSLSSSSFSKSSSLSTRSPTPSSSPTVALLILGLVLSWMSLSSSVVFAKIQQDHKEHSSDQVQALLGNIAELPCDLNAHIGEKIRLVLWSRNDTVIYSLDARDKQLEEGQHWSNEQALGGRAYFRIATDPPSLVIENVKESDAGLYKCRLDFKNSPTVYHSVNLTVIVPPQKVVVVDERGSEYTSTSQLTPYSEGSSLRLTCISTGGWPVPKVSWWRENALLDDTWEVSSEHVTSTVVSNTLTIGKLQRSDLNARLTCQAANNNITIPVSTTVMLEMNFRPLDVKMVNKKLALSAEKEYTLECQSSGARPPAVMTWMRGSSKIKHHRESVSKDENVTTSIMTFIPTLEDSGKVLACRAENPKIPGSMIEDGWKMDIHFVPQVSLDFGSKINSTHIREGEDVYFECSIKANPWIQKVSWRHNGRLLSHNTSAGIIISNQSLVLQSITRKSAGLYTCVGTNSEGDGASNPVVLNVKYAPVCKSHQQTVYGIARQEQAKILCDVDANPDTDLHFRWKFNNSAETIDIQQSHFQVERHRSTLTYKPMTELDYGTVLCWASHETIGTQKIPCVYHIIPAGKPDAVSNCSILNQTFDSLFVSCVEGFNGGLQQSFVIEIWDFHSQHVIRNLTNHRPVFNVRGLEPGASYIVRIYAVNSKGRSEVQVLQASTLKAAEKQTGYSAEASSVKPNLLNMTPILGILIAVVATLILVAIVIVLVMRGRGHNGEDKRVPKNNGGLKSSPEHDKSTVPLKKSVEEMPDVDDKNPDVVPHSSEIDGIDPDEKVFLERLNNTSRFYETIPRAVRTAATPRPDPNSSSELVNNVKNRTPRTGREEVTYAELSLPNSPAYHPGTLRPHQAIRPQEPIIYAQIDPLKSAQCVPVGVHEQQTQTLPGYPLTLPHPSSEQQGEEFVHLRPENAHAVYSNSGTNMRF